MKIILRAKDLIKKILAKKHQLGYIYFKRKINNELDREMLFVSQILKSKRRFLDIGSNIGIYSYHFKNMFRNIDAFEPIEEIPYLYAFQSKIFKIHNVALSNCNDELDLYIPTIGGDICTGLASLEKRNGEYIKRTVGVTTIDSYNFDDVDLIKIDVEGHERAVIEGALKTIKRTLPVLIVEIEQRHISTKIDWIFKIILDLNYDGFFLVDGALISITEFCYEINQKPYLTDVTVKEYVNNFIFIPRSKPSGFINR